MITRLTLVAIALLAAGVVAAAVGAGELAAALALGAAAAALYARFETRRSQKGRGA